MKRCKIMMCPDLQDLNNRVLEERELQQQIWGSENAKEGGKTKILFKPYLLKGNGGLSFIRYLFITLFTVQPKCWSHPWQRESYQLACGKPFSLFFFFFTYFPQLHFQCYPKVPHTLPHHTPLPTHSHFLTLEFPCTGAYKVCKSNGPLFPVMAN
jgi:hypothetical protein